MAATIIRPVVVIATLSLCSVANVSAAPTFVRIADTSDGFSSFGNPYSLNDNGQVAFRADVPNNISEIRVGAGGPTALVTDTRGRFSSFPFPPAINSVGTVSFTASLDAGGDEVWALPLDCRHDRRFPIARQWAHQLIGDGRL